MAIAVFKTRSVVGEAVAKQVGPDCTLSVKFTKLPEGKHGFHIHKAGDLRGEGCQGACAHWHIGSPVSHGGLKTKHRHTGDLGNVAITRKRRIFRRTYTLPVIKVEELWGRTLIVHADEDDLGKGPHEDSKTTGHSGKRIACAIFGRTECD
jgi:Cu-Zn family superoxide dismutase